MFHGARSPQPTSVQSAPKQSRCSIPSAIRRCCAWESISSPYAGIEILGKAEFFNPGGSVKKRTGRRFLNMILDGERSGKLNHSRVLLDSTSGNTGIAYAMIGAVRGYQVKLCMPANASMERKRILKAYGAEVVFSDAAEGSDGAIRLCREVYRADPDRYFYPDQYNNPANWKAHFEHTGPEIIQQSAGRLTHFVAAMGTEAGTFTGVIRGGYGATCQSEMLFGAALQRLPWTGRTQTHGHRDRAGLLRRASCRRQSGEIETEDAYTMVRRMAREEGLMVGISSGCNVHAATLLARELAGRGESATIVTVLCDSADKYLSEHFWDE